MVAHHGSDFPSVPRGGPSPGLSGVFWLAMSLGAAGCGAELDATHLRGPERVEATIPYTGVREDVRQFPDYGGIKATILVKHTASSR